MENKESLRAMIWEMILPAIRIMEVELARRTPPKIKLLRRLKRCKRREKREDKRWRISRERRPREQPRMKLMADSLMSNSISWWISIDLNSHFCSLILLLPKSNCAFASERDPSSRKSNSLEKLMLWAVPIPRSLSMSANIRSMVSPNMLIIKVSLLIIHSIRWKPTRISINPHCSLILISCLIRVSSHVLPTDKPVVERHLLWEVCKNQLFLICLELLVPSIKIRISNSIAVSLKFMEADATIFWINKTNWLFWKTRTRMSRSRASKRELLEAQKRWLV